MGYWFWFEVWTLISLLRNSLMFLLVSILIFFFSFAENEVRTIAVCFHLCNSLVSLNFWVEIMAWVVDFGLSYGLWFLLWLVLCFSSFSFGRDDVRTQLFASSFLFFSVFLEFSFFRFLKFWLKLCLKLLILVEKYRPWFH